MLRFFVFFFFFCNCRTVFCCLNFAHEWSVIATGTGEPSAEIFGLADAFCKFREAFATQRGLGENASETISLVGVFFESASRTATPNEMICVKRAVNLSWPPGQMLVNADEMVRTDEFEEFVSAAKRSISPLCAFVRIKKAASDQLILLDLIFFNWVLLRSVLREEINMTVQVINRSGELVFLDEFEVSPTILADTMLSPSGNFLTYFEKHDSKPWVLDFGEIFQDISSSTYLQRSEQFRMPNLPSSIQMSRPSTGASESSLPEWNQE